MTAVPIKYLAKALSIIKIASVKTAVVFTFEQSQFKVDVVELVKQYGTKIKVSPGVKPRVTLEIGTMNERQILNDVTEFLKAFKEKT